MRRWFYIVFFVCCCALILSGCGGWFKKSLKPLPAVDPSDPNVWSAEKCKYVPKVWWNVQGQDPSKWEGWHCYDWKIYDKKVAP